MKASSVYGAKYASSLSMLQHIWADERECDVEGNIEDFIDNEKELTRLIEGKENPPETLELAEEVIRYHTAYKPHHKAHVIYIREDCDH